MVQISYPVLLDRILCYLCTMGEIYEGSNLSMHGYGVLEHIPCVCVCLCVYSHVRMRVCVCVCVCHCVCRCSVFCSETVYPISFLTSKLVVL